MQINFLKVLFSKKWKYLLKLLNRNLPKDFNLIMALNFLKKFKLSTEKVNP